VGIETGALPSVSIETGALPSVGIETGALPSVGIKTGALPSVGIETGALPSVGIKTGALPSVGIETGALPSVGNDIDDMVVVSLQTNRSTGDSMPIHGASASGSNSGSVVSPVKHNTNHYWPQSERNHNRFKIGKERHM
jgi:hypothetical protein